MAAFSSSFVPSGICLKMTRAACLPPYLPSRRTDLPVAKQDIVAFHIDSRVPLLSLGVLSCRPAEILG